MSALRIFGFVLILAGALALAYGGFSYTKDSRTAELGPLSFTVEEKERISVPTWLGIGAVIGGGLLLLVGGSKR